MANLGCKEDQVAPDKPMLLQSVDENADEQNDTETEDDPRIFLERIKTKQATVQPSSIVAGHRHVFNFDGFPSRGSADNVREN